MNTNYLLQQIKSQYLFLLLILLLVASCIPRGGAIQTVETETSIPTETAVVPTSSPDSQATLPPTTTIVAPTFTPTSVTELPTASPTPLPTATLTLEEKSEILAELMHTNGGCDLPCWWGIVPGDTRVESAKVDLVSMGANWLGNGYASIGVNWGMSIEFEVSDEKVQVIKIGSSFTPGIIDRDSYAQGWQHYNLTKVLERFGIPTQVFVYSPFRADPGGGPSYHLLVFYENLGIVIEYRGNAKQIVGGRYQACPDLNDIWQIDLFLYQPNQVDNVVERVLPPESIDYIAGPETVYDLISWQGATGNSLESFYETFSTQEESCFEFANQ